MKIRYMILPLLLLVSCGGQNPQPSDNDTTREDIVAIILDDPLPTMTQDKKQEDDKQNEPKKTIDFNVNGVKFSLVWVEGGSFKMGDSENGPIHNVRLDGFYMGQTEVTQNLWEAVTGYNPSDFKGDQMPVALLPLPENWELFQEFLKQLRSMTGENFRLPTEAEWEYAARGGVYSKDNFRYSGSNYYNAVSWNDHNSNRKPHPVATKLPNKLGIYDMSGNVWEQCSDWYTENYSPQDSYNPKGPNYFEAKSEAESSDWYDTPFHVQRGGAWDCQEGCLTISNRLSDSQNCGYDIPQGGLCGLRIVLDSKK